MRKQNKVASKTYSKAIALGKPKRQSVIPLTGNVVFSFNAYFHITHQIEQVLGYNLYFILIGYL